MTKNYGIWIDTKQAIIVKLTKTSHQIKKIPSAIETRVRVEGESKKYGRFGGQYLTYEKNRLRKRKFQTKKFTNILLKELSHSDALVLFGPANMKRILEKEINSNILLSQKLKGVFNSELLTENQMVAWVKNFYSEKKT